MSYRPYTSDSDTGSESDETAGSMYEESVAEQLAGPDFASFAKQLAFNKNRVGPELNYYPFDMSGVKMTDIANFQDKQNILLIDSRNRDRLIFPYATLFSIRLPRTYRNVTFLQLAQINLLSAFFYFNATKQNISFPIYEQGRTTPTANGLISTITNVNIRQGSYGINDLLAEVQLQCNNVPLFFDFPNGFTDFSELFTTTGDYSLNFNSPGDSVYDREHQKYILSPTIVQIINFYFQTNGLTVASVSTSYSLSQTQVAYYYPVLKELYLDNTNPLYANLNLNGFGVDVNDRILYSFQGLNDPVVLAMIQANISVLDEYRIQHTFLYANANEYVWSYETNNNRISVVSSNLNNSLVNLLNQRYNYYLTNALIGTGITPNQFSALYNQVIQANAIFNSMYTYLQTSIGSNWAITYGSYSPEFYLNMSNVLFLQNSCNLSGYSATQYVNSIGASNITTNVIIKSDSPNYWPNLQNMIADNIIENPKQIGYSFIANDVLQQQDFTDLSGFVNINLTTRSIDIEANVLPATYTYFKFRSPVNQNLQVETLPRPLGYRYVAYNSNYSPAIQSYFDLSYSFVENVLNQGMNNLLQPPQLIDTTPLQDSINVLTPVKYYIYTAPRPAVYPGAALVKYEVTVTINASAQNGTFEDGFQLFMYHDVGVFNADVVNYGEESQFHYKYNVSSAAGSSQATLTFVAVNNNTYYFILRATNPKFNTIHYTISLSVGTKTLPIYNTLDNFNPYANPATDPTNYNYATLYDPDILRLPSASNLFNAEPINPLLSNKAPPMGGDRFYKSDDLTDYRPYIAGNSIVPSRVALGSIGIDPLEDFTFQYLSPYNEALQEYVYQTSNNKNNTVLDPNFNPYIVNNTERDYKIVQWYSQNYIPVQNNDSQYSGTFSGSAFTSDVVNILGYNYDINNNIRIGNGVVGFTFLPSDGIWNMEELWFKSAVTGAEDPNASIQYVGIFYTLDIYGKTFDNLSLSNAVTVLTLGSTMKYAEGSQYDYIGGTYYQFTQNTSTSASIYGYTQNSNTMINNQTDFYCAIAFTDSNTPQTIVGLAGTTVPYPEFSYPSSATNYFGVIPPAQATYLSSPGVVMPYPIPEYDINPNAGPPPSSIYYSQYEQSIPIITTGVQYLTAQEPILNAQGLTPFQEPIQGDAFSFYWEDKIVLNNQYLQAWQYLGNYASTLSTQAQYTWTLDTLFSPANSETFLTFCTAQSNMYLMGLQGEQVIIKRFDEATGQVKNINVKAPELLPSELVQRFFMRVTPTLSTQYVFSTYDYPTSTSRYYINKNAFSNEAITISTIDGGHDMWCDPSSNNIYILPYNRGIEGNILYSVKFDCEVLRSISSLANKYYDLDQPTTTNVPITGYTTITSDFRENIYLLSSQLPNNYFQLRNSIQRGSNPYYNTTIWNSEQLFPDPITGLQCGFGGSLWAITAGEAGQTMYGAIPGKNNLTVTTAWQIFYPCFKARFSKKFNYVDTITDTYSQIGDIVQYPEYTHPQLYFYSNWTSFSNDCYRKFGKETASNLAFQDLSGTGYGFNSYIYDIALDKSSNFNDADPDSYYYLVLRGYSPTEQFGCMTRFFLPERYDFGYTTLNTLIEVIDKVGSEPLNFNPDFSNALSVFDKRFYITDIYGENVVAGFNGSTITTYGFKDYLAQYSTLYASFQANYALVNSVASNVASNMSNYVNRYLSRILPSTALQRQNIQNSLPYTLMFKTGIINQTLLNAPDNWGLGWNLGFAKADYGGYTFYKAPSFYKILDEYLYLQMNPEFNLNRLDTTSQENLAITRDPQGNVNQYAAKLLLTNFGAYTTSLVQNGANFNPPIEKLDTLYFSWVDINGNALDNKDSDWDASIQITEHIETLAIPKNRVANGFLKF